MNTNELMTREQLDAIKTRAGKATTLQLAVPGDTNRIALYHSDDVDTLIAEVERLRALTTVDDAMVKRATHAIAAHWHDMHTNESLGRQQALAIAALDAALNPGEES